jgi:hypothetical protein
MVGAGESVHIPPPRTAVVTQPDPSLADNITLPVGGIGAPAPGATTPNVKETVIGWPTNAVEGDTELSEIEVLAWFTVCNQTPELLEVKFASPL